MIDLYYWPTPNGKKVTIFLEEAGTPYNLIPLDIGRGDQFSPAYLKINPNHRMPSIIDHEPAGGGAPISVFESGAILLYLAEKAQKFWPQELHRKYEVVQWVFWQMANQGPKTGERGHFSRLGDSKGDQSYAVRRFSDEVNRIFGVLNNRLYDRPYLAGDEYSVADMASYPWASLWQGQGQDIEEFKYVKRWLETLAARPALQRGMELGKDFTYDPSTLPPEEQARRAKILFNQRALPVPP
jgi:GSH-dependent disulfide-bond oxidoreductase